MSPRPSSGRQPSLSIAQVQTLGSLLIARSSASPAPTEKKRVIQNPGSLRYARAKRQHVLEAKRSVLEYIIEKGTGGRVTARDIFVHSDYSVESSRWTDFLSSPLTALRRRRSGGGEKSATARRCPTRWSGGRASQGTSSLFSPGENG